MSKSAGRKWLVLCMGTILGLGTCAARASFIDDIDEIIVFGDSLSDTGNLFAATSATSPFPPPSQGYVNGRFSNGPVWVEYLASLLGLPNPDPNLLGGSNYAWGGAETGFGLSARGTPNLGTQVATFLSAPNVPDSSDLVVLYGGSNDFNNTSGPPPNPSDLVANISAHITTLAGAAAPGDTPLFMIPNLPPLGQTQRAQELDTMIPGVASLLDALSVDFNMQLSTELTDLALDLSIDIIELDVFDLTQDILADPMAFGFTNTTETARLPNGVEVGEPGIGIVSNPNEYFFFDDVHPTTTFHVHLADRALVAVPEPATYALMGLGLVGIALVRRRRFQRYA